MDDILINCKKKDKFLILNTYKIFVLRNNKLKENKKMMKKKD